jgi:FixJ family two-component response regulator
VSDTSAVVHVVDDDSSFRTAVSRLLRASGYEVKLYKSAGDFLLEPPAEEPGCILLDLRMPGPSGLELQDAIRKRGDSLPVIFLTGHGDVRQSVRAMRQGAVDFLTKPVRRQELLAAIGDALERQNAQSAVARRRRELASRYASLTPRERGVFEHVVAGRMNKQIAAALGTSERTVKAHRSRIMEKMRADSLAELVQSGMWLRQRTGEPASAAPPMRHLTPGQTPSD